MTRHKNGKNFNFIAISKLLILDSIYFPVSFKSQKHIFEKRKMNYSRLNYYNIWPPNLSPAYKYKRNSTVDNKAYIFGD